MGRAILAKRRHVRSGAREVDLREGVGGVELVNEPELDSGCVDAS